MTRKRKAILPCGECFGPAHLVEFVDSKKGKTRFAVVCDDKSCPRSEMPKWMFCQSDEDAAIADWNGR